ncbi:MAG: hypothetical protein P4N60_09805 [Verrucomicrobiae bacterium]|nr:hypothetical protein [Verrucomicrobiae bacterium]
MKKCTYCGKEYPDDMASCAIDQFPLESATPAAAPTPLGQAAVAETGRVEPDDSEGYRFLEIFYDAFEADRFLKRLSEASIPFRISQAGRRERSGFSQYRTIGVIEVYVLPPDYDRANRILTADWKV